MKSNFDFLDNEFPVLPNSEKGQNCIFIQTQTPA